MRELFRIESVAVWAGVICLGILAIGSLTRLGKSALRHVSVRPAPPRTTRVLGYVIQALCLVPAVWHVWLGQVSRRYAAAGHNEEAIFAAIGDKLVWELMVRLHEAGIDPSLEMIRWLGVGIWVVVGLLLIFMTRRLTGWLLKGVIRAPESSPAA